MTIVVRTFRQANEVSVRASVGKPLDREPLQELFDNDEKTVGCVSA